MILDWVVPPPASQTTILVFVMLGLTAATELRPTPLRQSSAATHHLSSGFSEKRPRWPAHLHYMGAVASFHGILASPQGALRAVLCALHAPPNPRRYVARLKSTLFFSAS